MAAIAQQGQISRDGAHSSYLRLAERWPPHPIRDDADYDDAVDVIYPLSGEAEAGRKLDGGEVMYLEVITLLIGAYDAEHYSFSDDFKSQGAHSS